eukprot:TRINITY_DN2973_c0_g1_i1.p1 TRINITY_DN2973_c0_g1~~TRINITY_DN2973_c0_g1_i1.p1  ORF type:complete len:436 (+),score=72.77 TRINITY_DN2973_c0_g1_i1:169-1476(+)
MARCSLIVAFALICVFATITTTTHAAPTNVLLTGAGSTLVQGILATGAQNNWANNFHQVTRLYASVRYDATGSDSGQTGILKRAIDFGVSDAPLTLAAQKAATNLTIFHYPIVLGGVEVIYNLQSGVSGKLNLSADALASIFQGTITRWNDPLITADNPGLTITGPIQPVVRQEGSGTTYVFSSYLSRASSLWTLGVGKQLNFGSAVTQVSGNNAEVTYVVNTPGSISFAPYGFAPTMGSANLKNADGFWLSISSANILAAVQTVEQGAGLPFPGDSWERVDLTNQPGTNSWPLVTFSYALFYRNLTYLGADGAALSAFMSYINSNAAQNIAPSQRYVPLPAFVRNNNQIAIDSLVIDHNYSPSDYYKVATATSSPAATTSTPTLSPTASPTPPPDVVVEQNSTRGITASLFMLAVLMLLVALVVGYHAWVAFKP